MSSKPELPDKGGWPNRSFEEMWNSRGGQPDSQSRFPQLLDKQEDGVQFPSASVEEYPESLLPPRLRGASAEDKTRYLLSAGHTEKGLALMCGLSKQWREIPGVVSELLDDILRGADNFIRGTFTKPNKPERSPEEQKFFERSHTMIIASWVKTATRTLEVGSNSINRLRK